MSVTNSPSISNLRNASFAAIGEYLKACGWEQTFCTNDETFLYMRDPITNALHRPDFAWFIQTERDCHEVLSK